MKHRATTFSNFVYCLPFHKKWKFTGTWSVTICETKSSF